MSSLDSPAPSGAPDARIPRLLYFPWAGRAGAIRDCLRLGSVDFDDVRLPYSEYQRVRDAGDLPFHLLPVLELEDGTRIGQSNTILRWAARRAGLVPTDAVEALRVESVIDMVEDYAARLSVTIREPDAAVRSHQREGLATRWMPELYRNLSGCLERSGSGWLVGSALSAADLKAWYLLEKLLDGSLDGMPTDALAAHPALHAWMRRVGDARPAEPKP